MTAEVQLRRTKGWRLPPGAKSVARPTRYGNPFVVEKVPSDNPAWGTSWKITYAGKLHVPCLPTLNVARLTACTLLRAHLLYDPWATEHEVYEGGQLALTLPAGLRMALPFRAPDVIADLAGLDLACWCPLEAGDGCHRRVLLEVANEGR